MHLMRQILDDLFVKYEGLTRVSASQLKMFENNSHSEVNLFAMIQNKGKLIDAERPFADFFFLHVQTSHKGPECADSSGVTSFLMQPGLFYLCPISVLDCCFVANGPKQPTPQQGRR